MNMSYTCERGTVPCSPTTHRPTCKKFYIPHPATSTPHHGCGMGDEMKRSGEIRLYFPHHMHL